MGGKGGYSPRLPKSTIELVAKVTITNWQATLRIVRVGRELAVLSQSVGGLKEKQEYMVVKAQLQLNCNPVGVIVLSVTINYKCNQYFCLCKLVNR